MRLNGDTGTALADREASVRLAPGSHSSPRDGVCIVELASVIGGEEFSDRPDCVCPVIAAFLRAWNDRAGHADRQRLMPYAARIVGTHQGPDVTRARRDICLEWGGADLEGGVVRRALALVGTRARIGAISGVRFGLRLDEGAGEYAARVAFSSGDSGRAFKLLDALLYPGADERARRLSSASDAALDGHGSESPNGHPVADADVAANGHGASPTGNANRADRTNGNEGSAGANGRPAKRDRETA